MKKIALFTAFVLLLCLAGCGAENGQALSAATERGMEQYPPLRSAEPWEAPALAESETAAGSLGPQRAESEPKDSEEDTGMRISVRSDDHEIVYALNDSRAARELYEQLPLTTEVEPFSNNEMTFYPPEKLDPSDTPLSSGEAGTLSYYAPWGDVVMFYGHCDPNGSLYGLGTVVSGADDIAKLAGSITVSACE